MPSITLTLHQHRTDDDIESKVYYNQLLMTGSTYILTITCQHQTTISCQLLYNWSKLQAGSPKVSTKMLGNCYRFLHATRLTDRNKMS